MTGDDEPSTPPAEGHPCRGGCPACEAHRQALLASGSDPQRALRILAPVVSGELACGAQPQAGLALDAEIRSGLGDLDGAAVSFRRSWHLVCDEPSQAGTVARCLRVLVRIGNTDRAVDHLLPRLGWLEELGEPGAEHDAMWFAGTAAWVLAHGRRLGLAPEVVHGRPATAVESELAATAHDLARRLEQGAGSPAARARLATALDDSLVASEPTLPPTRLPGTDVDPGHVAPTPTSGAEVVALADRVAQARRDLEPGLERALRGWAAARAAVLPTLDGPQEWAAASALDRASAYLLRDPRTERARLEDSLLAAERAGDTAGVSHTLADLAILDVRVALSAGGPGSPQVAAARGLALSRCRGTEEAGHLEPAAAAWRWYALTTRPADAVEHLRHAADLYEGLGLTPRQALCLLDAAPMAHERDPAQTTRLLEEAERLAGDHPSIASQALDLRARMARAGGDPEAAIALHERALAAAGVADGTRVSTLFALCDVLVDLADWERLEPRAADALAVAVRLRDPVALAVAQRHLGLAWVESGRPGEAAELLEAALPVIEEHVPPLVGPTGWALGNTLLELGSFAGARRAFATASAGFEPVGRVEEAAHCQYRAGMAAWDAGDHEAAAAHLDDAVGKARTAGTVEVLFAAARSRAVLRAATEDLDAGLADLDAVLADVERFAATRAGAGAGAGAADRADDGFDAEVHEPDILREGAHLLAEGGRTDDALARLARAQELVGGDFELVLRAEAGALLADADRLEEAEPSLRFSIAALHAAGLTEPRVAAAAALACALERAGREDEAAAVWAQAGPDGVS